MPIDSQTIKQKKPSVQNKDDSQDNLESDLKDLLAKNIELSEEILKSVKYIKKYIFWQKIFGIVKVLIIVVPLVFGYIMLAPYLDKAIQQYEELLDLKQKAKVLRPQL